MLCSAIIIVIIIIIINVVFLLDLLDDTLTRKRRNSCSKELHIQNSSFPSSFLFKHRPKGEQSVNRRRRVNVDNDEFRKSIAIQDLMFRYHLGPHGQKNPRTVSYRMFYILFSSSWRNKFSSASLALTLRATTTTKFVSKCSNINGTY